MHHTHISAERTLPLHLPLSMDVLYFALVPDLIAKACVASLAQKLQVRFGIDRFYPVERLHLSLLGLGPYAAFSSEDRAAIGQAAATVALPPFELTFDRIMRFGRTETGPLVLLPRSGVEPLGALAEALGAAVVNAGVRPAGQRPLNPHVTLNYRCGPVPETLLDEPLVWPVEQFVLIHGLHGQGRHTHLGRWGLRRRDPLVTAKRAPC